MDKVVVVTGGSGGIGAELAKQLAAKGAKVVLAARRKDKLDAVAQEIGAHALAVVTDVTKRSDVERLAKAAIEHFGHIAVWGNNAGRGISRSVSGVAARPPKRSGSGRRRSSRSVEVLQLLLPGLGT